MNFIRKYLYLIILSLALVLGAVGVSVVADVPRPQLVSEEIVWPEFVVRNPDGSKSERVTIYDAGDGNCYVFLPSYAELDSVTVTEGKGQTFALGGVELTKDRNCGDFQLETPYAFTADGERIGSLWLRRSEKMAAMYIDTASGNLENIHRDTFPTELASARLYTAGGELDHLEDYARIKGRGYTSWMLDKKSYTLSLGKSTGLMGMGKSEKWTLIACGPDPTCMRNRIVYSFAEQIAPSSGWAPDCAFTELYLNGEYMGLYLLCQKPDAGPDHMNLAAEDYYFELTTEGRGKPESVMIAFCPYKVAEVLFPKKCTQEQANFLEAKVSELHEVLLAEEDTQWQDYIDMDSWARKYLLEEVFRNADGGRASIYFAYDTSEEKFFVGHCWDYDGTFDGQGIIGRNSPHAMPVKRGWRTGESWFTALYRKEEFRAAFTEIYEKEYRPLLQQYMDQTIADIAQEVRGAIESEYLRWPELRGDKDWESAAEGIITFLQERIKFLDALWIRKEPFYEIEIASVYYNLDVAAGMPAEELPKNPYRPDGIWYLEGTDIPFDATQPVTENVRLALQPASEIPPPSEETVEETVETAPKRGFATQDYITIASIGFFLCVLLCLVTIDFSQRRKDRRVSDMRDRSKMPS